MCTFSTKTLRHSHVQFETPARTILFLYQNHQDIPPEIQDLYESISMPDKPSSIFSRSSQNRTNRKQNSIIFTNYLILTVVMFVRTTFISSKM
jgi:hypothetical protein